MRGRPAMVGVYGRRGHNRGAFQRACINIYTPQRASSRAASSTHGRLVRPRRRSCVPRTPAQPNVTRIAVRTTRAAATRRDGRSLSGCFTRHR
ncbi:hypothetical protein HPB50_001919 [Hyalomma asiaticum]|uniref:Uncharacterized protein n=1 Tax=Hyalomma asiaticum TaxID=266040 RepID=A0ACB7TD90_HYAAI|nr:hypothetical protein HPB50_001919 [Hyalomma asiaticum]